MSKIKIDSEGQTGVDRAALDAPLQSNIKCGAGILMEEKKMIEKPHLTTLLLNFKVQTTKKELGRMSLIAMVL